MNKMQLCLLGRGGVQWCVHCPRHVCVNCRWTVWGAQEDPSLHGSQWACSHKAERKQLCLLVTMR